MKKVLAMLFLALSVSASFAQTTSNVVRWKTIVGNITVSNNDAVAGITPGPLLGARPAEGLASIFRPDRFPSRSKGSY